MTDPRQTAADPPDEGCVDADIYALPQGGVVFMPRLALPGPIDPATGKPLRWIGMASMYPTE